MRISTVREFRANVLLSAVVGGRAALALRPHKVEQVFTPAAAFDEVLEYLPALAKKKRLELDILLLACAALPVTVVERSECQEQLPTAKRRIGKRLTMSMCLPSHSG